MDKTIHEMSFPELVELYNEKTITQTEVRLIGLGNMNLFSDEQLLGHLKLLTRMPKKTSDCDWLTFLNFIVNVRYPVGEEWADFQASEGWKTDNDFGDTEFGITRFRRLAEQVHNNV